MNLDAQIRTCDGLTRSGQLPQARDLVKSVLEGNLRREQLVALADLARRTELFEEGIRLLRPYVRPSFAAPTATTSERVVYASLLSKLGLSEEALAIFEEVGSTSPEALLYRCFAHFSRWEYDKALPWLEQYLQSEILTEYERQRGKLNLAACHAYLGQYDQCQDLLGSLIPICQENRWLPLARGGWELRGMAAALQGEWKTAERGLTEAMRLSLHASLGHLFAIKWFAIMNLRRHGPTSENVGEMQRVRALAYELNHPETARDCDHYLAVAKQDRALGLQVYFGTPILSFRRRIREETASWLEIPAEYVISHQVGTLERYFDLDRGTEAGGSATLKPGQVMHRFLRVLATDLYRGQSVYAIFDKVFQDEYYNPASSPNRIHAVAGRLRTWLEENDIPLRPGSKAEVFSLETLRPYGFLIRDEGRETMKSEDLTVEAAMMLLKQRWPEAPFSSSDAADVMGKSLRSVQGLLKRAVSASKLDKTGMGPATQYQFKKAA